MRRIERILRALELGVRLAAGFAENPTFWAKSGVARGFSAHGHQLRRGVERARIRPGLQARVALGWCRSGRSPRSLGRPCTRRTPTLPAPRGGLEKSAAGLGRGLTRSPTRRPGQRAPAAAGYRTGRGPRIGGHLTSVVPGHRVPSAAAGGRGGGSPSPPSAMRDTT